MYMTVQKEKYCFHVKKKLKLLIPYCCVEERELISRLSKYFCNQIFVNKRNKYL